MLQCCLSQQMATLFLLKPKTMKSILTPPSLPQNRRQIQNQTLLILQPNYTKNLIILAPPLLPSWSKPQLLHIILTAS